VSLATLFIAKKYASTFRHPQEKAKGGRWKRILFYTLKIGKNREVT
jgi:hypothetical protein